LKQEKSVEKRSVEVQTDLQWRKVMEEKIALLEENHQLRLKVSRIVLIFVWILNGWIRLNVIHVLEVSREIMMDMITLKVYIPLYMIPINYHLYFYSYWVSLWITIDMHLFIFFRE
jgi:hypothetical protein